MNLFSEHRLCCYSQEQLKKMGITDTSRVNQRAADQNAVQQDATHQAALQGNVGTGVGMTDSQVTQMNADREKNIGKGFTGSNTLYDPRLSPEQNAANEKSSLGPSESGLIKLGIMDPLQLADARNKDAQSKILAMQQQSLQEQAAQKAMGASAQAAPQDLNHPTNGAANLSAGVASRLAGRLDKMPDRQTFIEQKRAEGMSDQQIRTLLTTLPPDQTGAPAAPAQGSPTAAPGATETPQAAPAPASPTATPGEPTKAPGKPGEEAAPAPVFTGSSLIRTLAATEQDPITQAIMLAQADWIDANPMPEAPMGQAQFNQSADAKAIATPYDAIQKILDRANTQATQSQADRKAFLDGQNKRNEQYIADAQANADAQLRFSNDKAVRDQADANKKKIDSQTIMLALEGGFGSHDGNNEILEARLKGEQAIIDLNKEFGFKRADVSLAFTQMHNEAFDAYQTNWLAATEAFEARVNEIDGDGIANQQAKGTSLATAYKDYVSDIKTARKDHATAVKDATTMVYNTINAQRDQKRATEASVISQAQWAVTTYGSGAKPFIEKLAKENPSVNLAGLMGGMTLTEQNQNFDNQLALMKEGRIGGGGGGGISFAPHEIKSNGQAISFEEFVASRKAEVKAKTDLSLEDVKRATDLNLLRKEYDAKVSAKSTYDPSDLAFRLEDRTKNMPKHIRENARKQVEDYFKDGKYTEADRFVDGLGSPLSATERNDMVQALNARNNVLRIQGMLNEFGQQGPVSGRLRDLNAWGVKEAELQSLITQTTPGLARGIFKEVGVLTDTDIARYTTAIPNSKNTVSQAQALTKELLTTINTSIESQLGVLRDSGLNTRDLRDRFESLPGRGVNDAVPASAADSDYVRSLEL